MSDTKKQQHQVSKVFVVRFKNKLKGKEQFTKVWAARFTARDLKKSTQKKAA